MNEARSGAVRRGKGMGSGHEGGESMEYEGVGAVRWLIALN